MSDELREISHLTPFNQLRRVGHASDREGGDAGQGRQEPEGAQEDQPHPEVGPEELAEKISAVNKRLAREGLDVRVEPAEEAPGFVELVITGPDGVVRVLRCMSAGEFASWSAHIEGDGGLLIDDRL